MNGQGTYIIEDHAFPEYIEHQSMIEQVKRGIALLDEECPNWQTKINLDKLDLSSGCDCILGQVFDHFTQGVPALFGFEYDDALSDAEYSVVVNHGFVTSIDYYELGLIWKVLLSEHAEVQG